MGPFQVPGRGGRLGDPMRFFDISMAAPEAASKVDSDLDCIRRLVDAKCRRKVASVEYVAASDVVSLLNNLGSVLEQDAQRQAIRAVCLRDKNKAAVWRETTWKCFMEAWPKAYERAAAARPKKDGHAGDIWRCALQRHALWETYSQVQADHRLT